VTPDLVQAVAAIARHCWRGTHWERAPGEHPRHVKAPLRITHLERHVAGGPYIGLAPIVPGESTTRIAVLDLDSHKGEVSWEEMVEHARNICSALEGNGLKPMAFRSSGGQGIHLIMLWDESQDAHSVRELLARALSACRLKNGTKGVKHDEVEIFPKQNSVEIGSFGSMFVLPFAGKSELLEGDLAWRCAPVPLVAKATTVQKSSTIDPALLPTSLADIRSALAAIPNEDDASLGYDSWRNLLFALHDATGGSTEGLALAHEFSSRSPKYDPTFLDERVWPYIKSERGNGITAATLFHHARQHGWQENVLDDFDVLPPEQEEPTSAADGPYAPPAHAPAGKPRFTLIPAAEFAKRAPPRWIIKNVLPGTELVLIIGQSGAGKSFLALDIAISIALGEAFRGIYRTRQGHVGIIAAEGAGGFRNRLVAAAQQRNLSLEALQIHVISDTPNLMQKEDVKSIVASIRALGALDVLIVDTLAQVTPGANENAGEDMGRVLAHCKALHRATDATIVLVHHIGKDETRGARGWSGVHAAADAVIAVTRSEVERKATITKMKDGSDGIELPFKLELVQIGTDEDGDPIESCVVKHIETADRKPRREPKGEVERLVWRLAHDLAELGGELVPMDALIDACAGQLIYDPSKRDRRREVVTRALQSLASGNFLQVENGSVRVSSNL
jgi:KaiC/GvpD/RAD55 family RecA-like ATPase